MTVGQRLLERTRPPALEIFLWGRLAIWALGVLLGARPRLNVAIVSVSTALLAVSVVQWSLWRWVA